MSVQSISLTPANTRNSKNNQLRMTFPFPFNSLGNEIGLSTLYIYYSWRNITSSYGNNTLSYIWNGTNFNITIPDGFYTISDISSYLQLQMFTNNHYTLDSNGNPYYYIELSSNTVYYAVTLTC